MDASLESLSEHVGRSLHARGWMLATAESCTGGWIGEVVTRISGSSAWYDRGFITYSNAAKEAMLGVRAETLRWHGAVSEPTVVEMAEGALRQSLAAVAVAVSGVAGPGGGTPEKPVGTVCIAWATASGARIAQSFRFDGDRTAVRRQTVVAALEGVIRVAEAPLTA
ncbi:MAG: nicotinamide-nucleotide amidohydrolase family protein [Burkholderiales bacterium]